MSRPGYREPGYLGLFRAWLLRPLIRLLHWFGVKPLGLTLDPPPLRVYVKISEDGASPVTVPLDLQRDWTVRDVKQHLAITLDKSAAGFRIILAGKELHDKINVGECDLGPQTVIHAIRVVYENVDEDQTITSESPMNACLLDLQLTQEEQTVEASRVLEDRRRAHFYVYCDSDSCRSVVPQPGKLRVRCSICSEGAVIVLADPCSWDDVLKPDKIEGVCQNSGCDQFLKKVFVQFYFKCYGTKHRTDIQDKPTSEVFSESPPLHLIRPNIRSIPCLACGDTVPEDATVVVFECPDQHVICIDCFKLYALSRLNERQFILDPSLGYTLGCPVGCCDSLISQLKHFKLLTSHDYDRYQRFGAEEVVLQAGGVLCPQPGCGMGILSEDRRVVCSNCQFVFCRHCLQGFHIGDCIPSQELSGPPSIEDRGFEMDPQRVSRARWIEQLDPSSLVAIRLTTKPCPKCRTPTERDGGCMHMSCTKAGCGFQWCWVCQTEWSRECMANHWFA